MLSCIWALFISFMYGFSHLLMIKRCKTLASHMILVYDLLFQFEMKTLLSTRLRCLCFLYVYFCVGWTGWCACDVLVWVCLASFPSGCFVGCVCMQCNGTIGCTNNNYASREKCKKCGQPKEVAAMPAIAVTGASFPTYPHYFSRAPGGPEQKMNFGLIGSGVPPQSLNLNSNWPVTGAEKFGVQPVSIWLPGGNYSYGLPYENSTSQNPSIRKGWRNGDWICNCGFHNYSSRSQVWSWILLLNDVELYKCWSWSIHYFSDSLQCKKCNAFPPGMASFLVDCRCKLYIPYLLSTDTMH